MASTKLDKIRDEWARLAGDYDRQTTRGLLTPRTAAFWRRTIRDLIGSEAQLIKVQRVTIHATMPLYSRLTYLDSLIAHSADPGAGLLAAAASLTARIQIIDAQLALNQQRLDAGFANELNTFNFINGTHSNLPNRNAYLTALGLQDFQVNHLATFQFPVTPASPVNRPPNRN